MESTWESLRVVLLLSSVLIVGLAVYRYIRQKAGKGVRNSLFLHDPQFLEQERSFRFFFEIAAPGRVVVRVVDLQGRPVGDLLDEEKGEGFFSVDLPAGDLAEGDYFCEVTVGHERCSKRFSVTATGGPA